jgi:PKD repeat protein
VFDASSAAYDFYDNLREETGVTVVTPAELLSTHTGARYIVIVGPPDGEDGTAGALVNDLLDDSGEVLANMLASDANRMAVRYSHWTGEQTIVLVSTPYPSDHIRVLGILKSMSMSVSEGAISVEYHNARACFKLDDMNTVQNTDATVWAKLDDMYTFSVDMELLDDETVGHEMSNQTGLEADEEAVGKYIRITVSEEAGVEGALFEIFYTEAELDRTDDGDAADIEDIDETTLALYWHDEDASDWVRVTEDLDWVNRTGLNTTDIELYGKQYAGRLWAEVFHLSTFGIAGRSLQVFPTVAKAGEDVVGISGDTISFDGSASSGNGLIVTYTWTFTYDDTLVTMSEAFPTFTFETPGEYVVTLEVTDFQDHTATDTITITILEKPPWTLDLGPVKNEDGAVLENVQINMTIGEEVFTATTDAEGMAHIDLLEIHVGQDVSVSVELEGYEPLSYQTRIDAEGRLVQGPAPLVKESVPPPPDDDDGRLLMGLVVVIIVVLIILVIASYLGVFTRRRGKDADDEGLEEADQLEPASPEADPEEDLDDLLDELDRGNGVEEEPAIEAGPPASQKPKTSSEGMVRKDIDEATTTGSKAIGDEVIERELEPEETETDDE